MKVWSRRHSPHLEKCSASFGWRYTCEWGWRLTLFILQSPAPKEQKTIALAVYLLQLLVNGLWSIIFFRAGSLWLAFAVILALDALVFFCFHLFRKACTGAAVFLAPYIAWLAFATYLNIGFAIVN